MSDSNKKSNDEVVETVEAIEAEAAKMDEQFQARTVFLVETTSAGVAVKPISYRDDIRQALDVTGGVAIFPSLSYALDQIDAMKQAVIEHFNRASQVGAQVIAQQNVPQDNTEDTQKEE